MSNATTYRRSHHCGQLREDEVGSNATLVETWIYLKLWFAMALAYKDDISAADRKLHHHLQAYS